MNDEGDIVVPVARLAMDQLTRRYLGLWLSGGSATYSNNLERLSATMA
jgi:hypothetical protein